MPKGKMRWLGHSFVEFTTATGKVILFDPWTNDDGNPGASVTLDQIEKADLVLISHDHGDHLGSAVAICKKTGAMLGGGVQTVGRLQAEGFETKQVVNFGAGYMVGGGVELDGIRVIATHAMHSSDSACALGHIVLAPDGTCIYHAGDTGIFGDMELLGKLYPMDVACLPMGGVFTMDAFQASHAAGLLKPAMVLPIHYGTFPFIAQTPDELVALTTKNAPGVKVLTPKVGETVVLG